MAKRPDKLEIAQMKILHDLGETPKVISKKFGRSHHTVGKYLRSSEVYDPETQEIIRVTKEQMINELSNIWVKAAVRIDELLSDDEKKPQLIPAIAALDRSFNQLRLLQGASTHNLDLIENRKFVAVAEAKLMKAKALLVQLKEAKKDLEKSSKDNYCKDQVTE